MTRMSIAARRNQSAQLLSGLRQHRKEMTPVYCNGGMRDPSYLEAVLQAHVDAVDDASNKHAAYLAAVAVARTAQKTAGLAARALATATFLLYGEDDRATLDHFGFKPARKTGPKTVAAKLAGARQGKLTRVSRGTMGSRQKRKVKGKR